MTDNEDWVLSPLYLTIGIRTKRIGFVRLYKDGKYEIGLEQSRMPYVLYASIIEGLCDGFNIQPNIIQAKRSQSVGKEEFGPSISETSSQEEILEAVRVSTESAKKGNIPTRVVEETFQEKALRLVYEYIKARLEKTDKHYTFSQDEVYVVWFCKTLQNWKALISTTLPDGMYYEVTYNGTNCETYIDAYKKWDNVCIPDSPNPTEREQRVQKILNHPTNVPASYR